MQARLISRPRGALSGQTGAANRSPPQGSRRFNSMSSPIFKLPGRIRAMDRPGNDHESLPDRGRRVEGNPRQP